MDTNFYGVVNFTRATVPLLREQRSGRILQISSVGGPPDPTWQHARSCGEMGCWGIYGISCPGTIVSARPAPS